MQQKSKNQIEQLFWESKFCEVTNGQWNNMCYVCLKEIVVWTDMRQSTILKILRTQAETKKRFSTVCVLKLLS